MSKFILLLLLSTNAFATCRVEQVCDDAFENCQVVDVCDKALDMPSLALEKPIPVALPSLKPLERLSLPPIGTTDCVLKLVGAHWETVCQ